MDGGGFRYVTTGDVITTDPGVLRGHGTALGSEGSTALVATVSGFVNRVNALVSVTPLNSRYHGEVGDVVVGRIVEVSDKQWRVDLNGRQHGLLQLSAINLPGGVQRRRTEEDSLQMRQFFQEDELISAEIQKIKSDGVCSLHTRNLKYGKLTQGVFLRVSSALIKRQKQHFIRLPVNIGVDLILGCNGFVWVSATPAGASSTEQPDVDGSIMGGAPDSAPEEVWQTVSSAVRERISRVRNCIMALSEMHLPIYKDTILDVYNESIQLNLEARLIVHPDTLAQVTQTALTRTVQGVRS